MFIRGMTECYNVEVSTRPDGYIFSPQLVLGYELINRKIRRGVMEKVLNIKQ